MLETYWAWCLVVAATCTHAHTYHCTLPVCSAAVATCPAAHAIQLDCGSSLPGSGQCRECALGEGPHLPQRLARLLQGALVSPALPQKQGAKISVLVTRHKGP